MSDEISMIRHFGDVSDLERCRVGAFCWRPSDKAGARVLLVIAPLVGLVRLPVNDGGTWTWDRNEDRPTITPSIRVGQGDRQWHGSISAGNLVKA
jgi:hypothetical protein